MVQKGNTVCVIGAGTMGSGIAAHLANIGFQVSLLDRDEESTKAAFERAKNARPPHFYIPQTANEIRLGNIQQNLDWVSEADWVCEAVVEKLDIKRDLFEKIEPILNPQALISTNTSGLQISLLTEGRSENFKSRFFGSHFFNPPRYLKLLELIPTDLTDPEIIKNATEFFENQVARRVVVAKDTPGFIANRYGMWSMFFATHVAEKLQLSVEEVDAITGPFIGRPKSGSFRLNDIVGLDIMQDIAQNLIDRCPHDSQTIHLKNPNSLQFLLDKGWIGGKVGQGFYKKESGQFLSFDLNTHAYREYLDPQLPTIKELGRQPLAERLQEGLKQKDQTGEYLREYLLPTLKYAHEIGEEISHNVQDFDRVMKWGFGWEAGPFEMIDMIGAEKIGIETSKSFYVGTEILGYNGVYIETPQEHQFRTFQDFPILDKKPDVNLRDLGNGVIGAALTTKMGSVSPTAVQTLLDLLKNNKPEKLVITSEAKVYSVGFDIRFFVEKIEASAWDEIDEAIANFQELNQKLRKLPSVAAVHGFCLGGGFEIAAGCQAIVASPETQIGLPEAKVGLIPGGAGTPLMRVRSQDSLKSLVHGLKTIALGKISSNADEARDFGYLTSRDITCYHPDRLITEAINLVNSISVEPLPAWQQVSGPFRGMADQMQDELIAKGELTNYDEQINDHAKAVFSASTYEDAVQKERESFLILAKEGLTQARLKHMLETGKPLRN